MNCNQNKLFQITGHQIKELVIPEQKHGSASLVVDESFFKESLEVRRTLLRGIDALITNVPGYCVCVTTADCVPVLLYDRRLQVVAAVHAGWKGTVQHIVSSVMEHMSRNFGTRGADVVACIGPSISLESFEVGDEVYEAFKESGFDMSIISTKKRKTGKHHIDLWEANRSELLYAGIPAGQIEVAGICTYIHQDDKYLPYKENKFSPCGMFQNIPQSPSFTINNDPIGEKRRKHAGGKPIVPQSNGCGQLYHYRQ